MAAFICDSMATLMASHALCCNPALIKHPCVSATSVPKNWLAILLSSCCTLTGTGRGVRSAGLMAGVQGRMEGSSVTVASGASAPRVTCGGWLLPPAAGSSKQHSRVR